MKEIKITVKEVDGQEVIGLVYPTDIGTSQIIGYLESVKFSLLMNDVE